MSSKQILLISHELSVTGAPSVLLRQAKYFKNAGHNVDIWSLEGGELESAYHSAGFNIHYIDPHYYKIQKFLKKTNKKYDLILCSTIETYTFVLALQHYNTPIVWFIHEAQLIIDKANVDKQFKSILKKFYNIYTVSEYAASIVKKYNSNVNIINNAIEDTFTNFSIERANPIFGYIGSITPAKGVDLLINAFLNLIKSHPNAQLLIAGDFRNDFASFLIEKTKNIPSIVWLGIVQKEEKLSFFNSIDILCVPSLHESSCLSLIEGAMYGKALITTKTTGANYLVKENDNGYIIQPNNEDEILKAMQKILTQNIRTMMQTSRAMYLEKSTCERENAEILEMLEKNVNNLPVLSFLEKKQNIYHKIKLPNSQREIYVFGMKLFSYTNKKRKK